MNSSLLDSFVHGISQDKEYWSGLPFLSLGDLLNPGIEPASPAFVGGFFTIEWPGKPNLGLREFLWRKQSSVMCLSLIFFCFWIFQGQVSGRRFHKKREKSTSLVLMWHYQWSVCLCAQSCLVWLFEIPWTVTHQAPLSMGFSRPQYLNGLSFPPPGDLPNPGIEPASLGSLALAGEFFTTSAIYSSAILVPSKPYSRS